MVFRDACRLDPITKLRQGPSTVSSVVIAFFFLNLLFNVIHSGFQIRIMGLTSRQIAVRLFVIALECFAFAMYFMLYQKCRPWLGWFCFLVGMIIGGAAVAFADLETLVDDTGH